MKRPIALLIAAISLFAVASCSKDQAPAPGAPAGNAAPAAPAPSLAKVPILPGYKYYAGGPRMKRDPFGRFRIAAFSGEVQQPPSRGMIFGVKQDSDQLEYKVWGNGVLLGSHKGVMKDGLYWERYAESYRDGKLVARERTEDDDNIKKSKLTTEDIDPDNGEVIRTKEGYLSYFPPAMPADVDADEDEDEDEDDAGTAPAAAPAAKPAAPVPAPAPAAPPAAKGNAE